MMKRCKHGFSLAEIMTVMVVIGVITVIAIATTVKKDKMKEKQNEVTSKSFYGSVDSSYSQILNYDAANGELTALKDQNSDNKLDSNDLRILFNKYMDGDDINCSKFGSGTNINKYIKTGVVCSEHPGKVVAGYYLNTACNSSVAAKETYTKGDNGQPETTSRTVANVCGYIVYGIKDGIKGGSTNDRTLGVDMFVIPLGNIGLRNN